MQNLRRINKEKDFWEGLRKYPEDQLSAKPNYPAVPPVCGFRRKGKETTPVPMPAPVWPFLRSVWKGRIFQVFVGHPGLGEIEIPYTNPLHLTSSMAHPKEWFLPENGGDTWGRK